MNITPLGYVGIIILFNSTFIGGASQLGDLSLSAGTVKAILAVATLGNGFLGGLVTMFSTQSAQVKQVLAMPGIEHVDVNAQANQKLAAMAVDKSLDKIAPLQSVEAVVSKIASGT